MSLKRVLLVAGMALLAVAAVAPASASAFTITDEGEALENAKIPLSGPMRFETMGTGVECVAHMSLSVDVDTVYVEKFELTTSTCSGFGILYQGCEVEGDAATGLPWSAAVNEKGLEASIGAIDISLKAKSGQTCSTTSNTLTPGTVDMKWINTQDETKKPYFGLEYGKAIPLDAGLGQTQVTWKGTFDFVGVAEGTYDIS